jgi:hypothetical protein
MCTILAIIGLLVVAKLAFVILFPVTAARIQIQQITRAADRMMQIALEQHESKTRRAADPRSEQDQG